jgi:hypothetical protein
MLIILLFKYFLFEGCPEVIILLEVMDGVDADLDQGLAFVREVI